jgi:hypothetical protein
MQAMTLGLHVRCGIEDNIWAQDRKSKMSTVRQIEQLTRISREFGREVADGQEARRIYRIGEFYASAEETLARNGFTPNRKAGQRGFVQHAVAADRGSRAGNGPAPDGMTLLRIRKCAHRKDLLHIHNKN